jgi:L-ascorbate metabolism protein UlaG (beta-lactamase superfamily)
MKKIIFTPLILLILLAETVFNHQASAQALINQHGDLRIELIRSATVMLRFGKVNLLVDPVLADVGTQPAIPFSDGRAIPLIPLPYGKTALVNEATAVLLTHYHPDHFDAVAEQLLPRNLLLFCQPGDDTLLRQRGFNNIRVVDTEVGWNGMKIRRFAASHHIGATGAPPFGESSSFAIQVGDRSLLFTGDAVLDERLELALSEARPAVIVANTGHCAFSEENPILPPGIPMTLTADELKQIVLNNANAVVVAVHMDAINHCQLKKDDLRTFLEEQQLGQRIYVPNEGEVLRYEELVLPKK